MGMLEHGRRRAALVLNPRARTMARLGPQADALVEAARTHFELVQEPDPDLPLLAQIARALEAGPEVLLVSGGDGTIGAAAEHIAARKDAAVALGVLPGGTMNRLAARLNLPADPLAAIAALATAPAMPLPAGRLNGRLFLYQALLGRPARLVRFRELQREERHGWLAVLRAGLRLLGRPFRPSLRLALAGQRLRAIAVVVTVPPPETAAQGFAIEAVEGTGRLVGLRQALAWLFGRLGGAPRVTSLDARTFAVRARRRRIRLALDGEMLLVAAPLRFRLDPAALLALRPKAPGDAG